MSASSPAQRVAFAPLSGQPKAEAVARQISQAIAIGLLPPGTRLPSETELAERVGVSTMTLRQALEILRQQGLVTTRRGRGGGSFVAEPPAQSQFAPRPTLVEREPDELRDLADYHSALAGAAAALAAQRITPASVAWLRDLAEGVVRTDDPLTRVRADARFHVEVAALSRSPRLTRAELAVQAEVAALLWLGATQVWTPRRAAREHLTLVEALAAGEVDRARALAEAHVRSAMERLLAERMRM